jgi:outer membrane protein OmpA-like peptidoglycan-associated protein
MTLIQANPGYTFLAVALAASLLYRPVIAADPATPEAQSGTRPATEAVSDPVQQDFDSLISEIEARQPTEAAAPAGTDVSGPMGTPEEQLNAARIQIGILQQAVIAALAARAEAEAQLETLWRDSRAEIDALKAAQTKGVTRISALESELAEVKGEVTTDAAGDIQAAAYRATDDAAPGGPADDAARIAPAAGPTELMLNEIHFNPGSAALTPGGKRKTLEAADKIKSLGASNVRIAGYTDTQGPAAFNMHLSLQRAKSIADLLESVGVTSEIIEVEGNGEDGAPEPTEDQVSEPLNRCAGIFAMVDLPAGQAQP